jgi:hypothetical protein
MYRYPICRPLRYRTDLLYNPFHIYGTVGIGLYLPYVLKAITGIVLDFLCSLLMSKQNLLAGPPPPPPPPLERVH